MVPRSATGDYGYSDTRIGPALFRVTFTSPKLRANRSPDQSHGLEAERIRVHDLALWRAAELARSLGYAAFAVEQDQRDIDITVERDRNYPAAPYPFLFGGPWRWRGGYWPYGYPPGYALDGYDREVVTGRVKCELTVRMLRAVVADSYDAVATLDRLRKQYGSAQFPRAIHGD